MKRPSATDILFRTALLMLLPIVASPARAQVTSVDIDLAPAPDPEQFEVRLRFNGAGFGEVLSGLVFTIRWPEASPALLPLGTPFCTGAAFPIGASAHIVDGGFRYRTWNMEGMAQLQADPDLDGGCGFSFPAGEWVTVLTLTPIGNTECTEFQIVNDAYTTANNRNYYLSLNGQQNNASGQALAAWIEPAPVQAGPCGMDCAGVPSGGAYLDECGECVGGTTGEEPCAQDCSGDWGGTAFLDNCGDCVGGTTGEIACVQDCAGDWGGTASVDECGACTGGTTGEEPCIQDCNGEWGGTASVDECGACTGGTTGEEPCIQDCNGEWGGPALPGSPCDDNDPCTLNDIWDVGCGCTGTPVFTALQISGPDTVFVGEVVSYTVNADGADLVWELPAGWTTTDPNTSPLAAEVGGTAHLAVSLCATLSTGGCVEQVCTTVWVDGGTGISGMAHPGPWLTVFPNPSGGRFTVEWTGQGAMPMELSVHDVLGRRVPGTIVMKGPRSLMVDLSGQADGTYLLKAVVRGEMHVVRVVLHR